jgi:hypothetical protein
MKILSSSIIITLLVLFVFCAESYAERICLAPSGCVIEMDTGWCEKCVDKEVIQTSTPVVKVDYHTKRNEVPVDDNTNPFYQSFYDPDYKPEKKVVSNLSLDNGGNIQRGIPKVVNILTDPIHGRVRHSIHLAEERKVARCVSGCKSSRWATLNLRGEGRLWKHKTR